MCNYLWLSVITLSLNREELVPGVVDINVSEGTELLVKMEQPDPLGKSSSEYGGSEEEREELGDKASEDGSVNVSSLLGNSYDSHTGNINEEAVGVEDKRDDDPASVLDSAKETVGAPKAGQAGVGAGEIEIIIIDSELSLIHISEPTRPY